VAIRIPARTGFVWLAASVLFVFVFAIRDRSAPWTFTPGTTPVREAWIEAAVISTFAALCLWQQLRKVFLTAKSQAPAFAAYWALFALGYPILGGTIMVARGDIDFVGPLSPAIDWALTARAVAAGQLAFLGAVFASLIWSIDEPGLAPVRLNREVARSILSRAVAGDRTLTPFAKAQLDQALQALEEDSLKLSARVVDANDTQTLERWWRAAKELRARLKSLDVTDYPAFNWSAVQGSIAALDTTRT
jgi:hypothetical protein